MLRDAGDVLLVERVEHHDFVDAVYELRGGNASSPRAITAILITT
jgi:hypothetical protein